METTTGATLPYALFLSPSHSELQRRIGVMICNCIRGKRLFHHLCHRPRNPCFIIGGCDRGTFLPVVDGVGLKHG